MYKKPEAFLVKYEMYIHFKPIQIGYPAKKIDITVLSYRKMVIIFLNSVINLSYYSVYICI